MQPTVLQCCFVCAESHGRGLVYCTVCLNKWFIIHCCMFLVLKSSIFDDSFFRMVSGSVDTPGLIAMAIFMAIWCMLRLLALYFYHVMSFDFNFIS